MRDGHILLRGNTDPTMTHAPNTTTGRTDWRTPPNKGDSVMVVGPVTSSMLGDLGIITRRYNYYLAHCYGAFVRMKTGRYKDKEIPFDLHFLAPGIGAQLELV